MIGAERNYNIKIVMPRDMSEERKILLKMFGADLIEVGGGDFEEAIKLVTSEKVLLDQLITKVLPLEESETGFHELTQGGQTMKILLQCSTND